MAGLLVSRVVLSLYGGGRSRVQTRELPTMFCIPIMNQTNGDTWHPCIGPRVSSLFACKWTRVNFPLVNNQPIKERHVIMMVRPSTWPYGLYGQVQSASLFFDLFDLAIKSRYLLHTDSIRENKYTAGIRKTRQTQWHSFRLNPSTLKIEQILIP
jgi:hypothetical protein